MDRPALRQLIADIEAGKVDCVVVYKVDRLLGTLVANCSASRFSPDVQLCLAR
jgi:DNA invertase Pin-like site-specific DNA recombinase